MTSVETAAWVESVVAEVDAGDRHTGADLAEDLEALAALTPVDTLANTC